MIGRGEFLTSASAFAAAPNFALPNFAPQIGIGVVCPLSGPYRQAGEQLANGVRAAIDDQNRQRGGLGQVYTMRTFDDQNAVADAIVNAQFACDDPTIVAVIGHLGAKGTIAALRTYYQAQMPIIAPAVTADGLTTQGYRNVFRLATRDFDEGQMLAKFVNAQSAPKAPHTLVQDGDYGADVANGYVQQFSALKVDNRYTLFAYDKPDYGKAADTALATKPDHIMLAGTAQDMGPIVKILRDKGYTGPLAAPQGFFDPLVATKYVKECEGITISTSMPYLAIAPTAYRIINLFKATYGPLVPVSAFAYAAAQLIISGVTRAGAPNRASIGRALALGGMFDTVVGSFSFSVTGDPLDPELYFYTIKDGQFAYVRQAHPSAFLSR